MKNVSEELRRFTPVLALDRVFPKKMRSVVLWMLGVPLLFLLGASCLLAVVPGMEHMFNLVFGGTLVVASIFFPFLFLSFYYNAFYLWGVDRVGVESDEGEGGLTYEVADILSARVEDATLAFMSSSYGTWILTRAGLSRETVDTYLGSERPLIGANTIELSPHAPFTFEHLAVYLYAHDPSLKEFFFSNGVREDVFFGAVAWVSRSYLAGKAQSRWWGRDSLGKIRGLGSEFSFGVAASLRRFMKDLTTTTVFSGFSQNEGYAHDTLLAVEKVLSRAKEVNVILVAEPGVGEMDILASLARAMNQGESVASIEGKHLVLFDAEGFVATYGTKQDFELHFMRLCEGAQSAGNLIIVIQNIAAFFKNTEPLGVDVEVLLEPYLVSPDLQFIATSEPHIYHQYLENRPRFMQRFTSIVIDAPAEQGTVRVLEDIVPAHEAMHDVLFTYGALQAIAESANRYIMEGVMPDKAVDLLTEIAPAARQGGTPFITEAVVQEHVHKKTGIPTGPITSTERDQLMHLEDTLHGYVIGQHAAIHAIADAMRRARAGVQVAGRPMGSFLFLGPTGVGKTETTKALARVFFGAPDRMIRLDMSEYNGADAVSRLMGTETESGALGSMLHEHPYGVLLLDEFEKGAREVHDLFLQILDEGMYTDGRGMKINARNTIIIATSNAGSDMLWEMIARGQKPSEHKDALIDHIVKANIYRPELLNRFDGVIVFEPLNTEEMHHVARLMLQSLAGRIKQKGYLLPISDVLIEMLVKRGYDPAFGVRPMRRVMQDVVEGKIAEKIIQGGLRPGDTIEFAPTDF